MDRSWAGMGTPISPGDPVRCGSPVDKDPVVPD